MPIMMTRHRTSFLSIYIDDLVGGWSAPCSTQTRPRSFSAYRRDLVVGAGTALYSCHRYCHRSAAADPPDTSSASSRLINWKPSRSAPIKAPGDCLCLGVACSCKSRWQQQLCRLVGKALLRLPGDLHGRPTKLAWIRNRSRRSPWTIPTWPHRPLREVARQLTPRPRRSAG